MEHDQLGLGLGAEFIEKCSEKIEKSAEHYSGRTLAYLGDAVFELLARGMFLTNGDARSAAMNKNADYLVNASAQSALYHKIFPLLTEEEAAVIKRGRNSAPRICSKNTVMTDYRHATGVEALFGYLYLKKRIERIMELFGLHIDDNGYNSTLNK